MKSLKSIALTALALASLTSTSSAVSVFVVSNDSNITIDGSTSFSGRAIFVATTTDISGSANAAFSGLLDGTGTSVGFDSALSSWIGSETPGIFVTDSFADGAIALGGASGDAGAGLNRTYMFLVAESGGDLQGLGVYTGPQVPALDGALFMNSADVGDSVGIGTSDGGFQLAPVIPEPSVAILGALGALGLLRRRR